MTSGRLASFFLDLRPRQVERWARLRSRGKIRFILVQGVLLYGGMLGLLFSAQAYLFDRHLQKTFAVAGLRPLPDTLQGLLLHLILPIFGMALGIGLLFGVAMWHLMEWLYRRRQRHAYREAPNAV